MPKKQEPKAIISSEVEDLFVLERQLADVEQELMTNETFCKFIDMQKKVKATIDATWKKVEAQMIEHDVKSLKGDWGSLTIAERLGWITTDELPAKFYKKIVDTKKLSDTFRLEGKDIKGAVPQYTKYLTKRIK